MTTLFKGGKFLHPLTDSFSADTDIRFKFVQGKAEFKVMLTASGLPPGHVDLTPPAPR